MPRDRFKQRGGIAHGACERANVIERTGKGDQAVTGHAAIRGSHADNTAERSWLANGPTGIGAKRDHCRALCYHRGGSTAGTTRHTVQRNWIANGTEGTVLI
jgi:hypothetical protein